MATHVLVLEVFQEFELSICSLRKNRCAERLHDLLDGYILVCELVASRAVVTHGIGSVHLER